MNLATEKLEWTTHTINECAILEVENERIFAGQTHSRVCIFNTTDGSKVHKLQLSDDTADHVYHVGITHKYLIANSVTNFCVFDKNTLQLIHTSKHKGKHGHGLSVNDRFIAYGTESCTYLLDHNSLEIVGTMSTKNQHNLQLGDEELLSNENCEILCWDILFWDIRNFSQKRRITLNSFNLQVYL
jgi:hypothetical protein